jgi:hypothetical protein
MPEIKATVPPETPGIISAIPIKVPLKYKLNFVLINLFYF